MGPTALLPLRRTWCYGFLSPLEIHRPRSGSNPRTLGPVASTLTTSPPRSTNFKYITVLTLIAGFRRDVDEICGLLGYYTASCGNCLPTFRDNVSVPSSRVKSPSDRTPEDRRFYLTVCLHYISAPPHKDVRRLYLQ
jgi:hypothetical protein